MPSIRDKLAKKTSKLASMPERLKDHPANLNNYQNGSFYQVDTDLIKPDPNQPRKYFNQESLAELSQSIKQKGVLQPVLIRKDQDDTIYLVAGERRFRAAQMAGLARIPAILTTGNPMELALIENLQRENLKPVEEAEALSRMMEEYSYTQEQLAAVIGKARTTITETLSLTRLPEEIKKECQETDTYPRRLLVEIVKRKTPEEMIILFQQVKEQNLRSPEVREITRGRPERILRTPVALTLTKTRGLTRSLSNLNITTVEENEKIQLIQELEQLKKAIEALIG